MKLQIPSTKFQISPNSKISNVRKLGFEVCLEFEFCDLEF